MRVGIEIAQHRVEWFQLLERVRWAETAGFDGAWVFDHFKPLYGTGPGPCLEGWTLLAGLAATTTRIRLGTLVTGMTYRHPSVLAAEVVTVDQISGGRLELGLGAGWFEREHLELGIPFPRTAERVDRLVEGIEVMQRLMTQDDVSFAGEQFTLHRATYRPRPVQRPYPPLWIGASGEQRMLPLVGRVADAWHCFASGRDYARKWDIVADSAEKAGRDPDAIVRSAQLSLSEPWDDVRRSVDDHLANGVGYLVCGWPSEGRLRAEEFVERLLPELAAV